MSLETPIKIREFQRKLYIKAKQEPTYRFYMLYHWCPNWPIPPPANIESKEPSGASDRKLQTGLGSLDHDASSAKGNCGESSSVSSMGGSKGDSSQRHRSR